MIKIDKWDLTVKKFLSNLRMIFVWFKIIFIFLEIWIEIWLVFLVMKKESSDESDEEEQEHEMQNTLKEKILFFFHSKEFWALMGSYMPLILVYELESFLALFQTEAFKFSEKEARTGASLFAFGGTLSVLFSGWIIDRLSRKRVGILFFFFFGNIFPFPKKNFHLFLNPISFIDGMGNVGLYFGYSAVAVYSEKSDDAEFELECFEAGSLFFIIYFGFMSSTTLLYSSQSVCPTFWRQKQSRNTDWSDWCYGLHSCYVFWLCSRFSSW